MSTENNETPFIITKGNKERIKAAIYQSPLFASREIALKIAKSINYCKKEYFVLGLATGSSPIMIYKELIKLYNEKKVSFKKVVTFNLDEYFDLPKESPQSYHYFMYENLFNHIDIKKENINLPSNHGIDISTEDFCDKFEKKIEQYGGIDLQLLGIGRTGHIGFNEPGSFVKSKTRAVMLDFTTRVDNSIFFDGLESVPHKAITMGINTILSSKEICIVAWGENKQDVVKKAIEGEVSQDIPATFLQLHDKTTFYLDEGAASKLTSIKAPWLVREIQWNDETLEKKAVTWLSQKVKKSILKLEELDYYKHGMSNLLMNYSDHHELNIKIFNLLQKTITGWPGGKPNVDDTSRPERANPASKRVILFSPHPDDDVISMGGTFMRLCEQNHEVHVAYQTSGNFAVKNIETLRYIEFMVDTQRSLGTEKISPDLLGLYQSLLEEKTSFNPVQIKILLNIKAIIRKEEARAGARFSGVKNEERIHFMNLPFYESGTLEKKPITQDDIDITKNLILSVKPHQIFCAGDLADPHGTHKKCLDIIFEALRQLKGESFMKDCWIWLYRGAWHEWDTHEIEMAVPMSPKQEDLKKKAIFFHKSQKDDVMFLGSDRREFWERAEQRNKETAEKYKQLGLAEYSAMEAFKRYHI